MFFCRNVGKVSSGKDGFWRDADLMDGKDRDLVLMCFLLGWL